MEKCINNAKFKQYYEMLIEKNKVMNLTAITDEDEVYIKHFYDSIKLLDYVNDINNIADLGSGAGFPGIPLKIVNPDIELTLIEPTKKRAKFLKEVIDSLNLENIDIIDLRAEELVKEKRASFSNIVSRAVAPLNVLLELAIPLIQVGGYMYAYKGSNIAEEIENAQNALKVLGAKIEAIKYYDLPRNMGNHTIIIIKKVKETVNKYPRSFSVIKNKPL